MIFIWWIVWALSDEPSITTSHWLSFLILAVAVDLLDIAGRVRGEDS